MIRFGSAAEAYGQPQAERCKFSSFDEACHGHGITVAQDDFQLAAKRTEAAYSPAEWLALGQRGRSAAIYKELRQIDHEAKRLTKKNERAAVTCDDEARLARREVIVPELGAHQDALDTTHETLGLAKQHLWQQDS